MRRPVAVRQRARLATLVIAVAAVLSGCHATGAASDPTGSSNPAGSSNSAGCHAGPTTVCLIATSSGHSITVHKGWTVGVDLHSADSVWGGLAMQGSGVLVPIGATTEAGGVISARYRAATDGHTALRATERPRCAVGQACPQFIVLWQVRITVLT